MVNMQENFNASLQNPTGDLTDTTYMFLHNLWGKKISVSYTNMIPTKKSARKVRNHCACQGLEIESGRQEAIQRSGSL